MKIRYRIEALDDLGRIRAWYSARNPAVATAIIAKVRTRVLDLADYPEIAPAAVGRCERVLSITGTPLLAIYRVDGDDIDVIAVIDARRDPADRFRR